MRIGVDATCWQNTRGYGRHARALLSALVRLDVNNHYTFFADAPLNLEPDLPRVEVKQVHNARPTALAAASNGHRSAGDMWRMSQAISGCALDLLLFPTIYSYVPVLSRAKKIVMFHDIIADKYPKLTLPSQTARLFWKAKVALGRWQADAIVTVSDYSRQCLIEHFKLPSERVFVVGEASDPIFDVLDNLRLTSTLESLGILLTDRFVIYVGGFGPHKNLEALVRVFARLANQSEFSDVRLVMVGEYKKEVFHSHYETIEQQIEAFGLTDRVIFTGYLPDKELVVLLNFAKVLMLPSLMEGFGLPAVEAAACGCPVIATTASPLPSLLKEGGLYVDPTNLEELELALRHVLSSEDMRQKMRTAGLAAARQLTWEAAAQQLVNLMRKVMVQ